MHYGTEAEFAAWMAARGLALPSGAVPSALLYTGSDYVDSTYETRLTGARVTYDQDRAWPRSGATAYGHEIPSSEIPAKWVEAAYMAAHASGTGTSLSTTTSLTGTARRKKAGDVEVEYFDQTQAVIDGASTAPRVSAIDDMVKPFLNRAQYGVFSV